MYENIKKNVLKMIIITKLCTCLTKNNIIIQIKPMQPNQNRKRVDDVMY